GLALLSWLLLRESPRSVGVPEFPANPENLFGSPADDTPPAGLLDLLGPVFRRPGFWYACLLSLAVTLLGETFNTWTPTYFREVLALSPAEAANQSAWFPLLGGCSVILAGGLSDWLGRSGRAAIIFAGMVLTGLALWGLGEVSGSLGPVVL